MMQANLEHGAPQPARAPAADGGAQAGEHRRRRLARRGEPGDERARGGVCGFEGGGRGARARVAAEVLDKGVRVNAVLPSTMDTPGEPRGDAEAPTPPTWVSLASAAGVVAFLLGDEARDVSGAAVPVYGRA